MKLFDVTLKLDAVGRNITVKHVRGDRPSQAVTTVLRNTNSVLKDLARRYDSAYMPMTKKNVVNVKEL